MTKFRFIILVFAALAAAAALTLLLSPREGGNYGVSPAAPDPSVARRAGAESARLEAEKKALAAEVGRAAALKAAAAGREHLKRRKKRVSRLRDPGEAMGGGEAPVLADKKTP